MKKKHGYTLPEILIVTAILILTITATMVMYVTLQKFWRGGSVQAVLQSEMRIALDHISRNVREALQAQLILDGDGIILNLDPNRTYLDVSDDIRCEYFLQKGEIIYVPDMNDMETQKVLLENVSSTEAQTLYQINGRFVTINLEAVDPNELDGCQASRLSISVMMRNE